MDSCKLLREQLKETCIEAGFFEAGEQAKKVAARRKAEVYLGMSNDYLNALGAKTFEEALDMIIHWRLPGVKGEIDEFLRQKGLEGFSAIEKCLQKAVSENRILKGKLRQSSYTIQDGYWLIDEKILADQKETIKAMTWLACVELGVPEELRERFLKEMEYDLGK